MAEALSVRWESLAGEAQLTGGETRHPLEGLQAIEVLDDFRIGGGVFEI